MRWMRKRLNEEEGFTLIELMVVVLIIAVLVAIAVPSFLGFRNRAQDRAAQADLRNTLLAEKAYWTDYGDFAVGAVDITHGSTTQSAEEWLKEYEPGIEVLTPAAYADPVAGAEVQITAGANADVACFVVAADSGNAFAVLEDAQSTGGTYYMAWANLTDPACPADAAAAATAGWQTGGFPTP